MLTEREQFIFEKFYLEDESDKVIGEWLHIEEKSVRVSRYRTLKRIREALGVNYEEG